MPIIEVRDAVKVFGSIVAVAGINLSVDVGECFGLLGPNGAGKTSLIRMITATLPLTSGNIYVDGKDVTKEPRRIKAIIGVMPQEPNFDPDLTVLQNLTTFARYFDIPKVEAKERAITNLYLFELIDRQQSKASELSSGMRRRLLIARALINQPRILILDEPTVGLDPQTKHLVWQRLRSFKDESMTLLLCTQNMEEAWYLCDRLAIINSGRIIDIGTPPELLARHGGKQILEADPPLQAKHFILQKLQQDGFEWQLVGNRLYIFQMDNQILDNNLSEALNILSRRSPTLEDVFIRLTGKSLTE